jgi:anti-anti-sigma factor
MARRDGGEMDKETTGGRVLASARMEKDVLVAALSGEINLGNSPDLRSALLHLLQAHGPRRAILNLNKVPYMDSSALAVLVETARKLGRGNVALTDLQPRVKGLLEIARLDSIFALVSTEQEALARK